VRLKLNNVTKQLFESNGWICDVTEHYNPYAGKTKDLFGFADLIASCPNTQRKVAIQTTTTMHRLNRKRKILSLIEAYLWMLSGNEIWIVHWKKTKKTNPNTNRERQALSPGIILVDKSDFPATMQESALALWAKISQGVHEKINAPEFRPTLNIIQEDIECLTPKKNHALNPAAKSLSKVELQDAKSICQSNAGSTHSREPTPSTKQKDGAA
jgi:hypothetical protein